MSIKTFDVLRIDAWRQPEGWHWNNHYKVGTIEVDPAWGPRKMLRAFREEGFLRADSAGKCRVDNDGGDPTTIEIQDKNTYEPLFAIQVEYE